MPSKRATTATDAFLKEFPAALADDTATIFVGAGVSMGAGYPSWKVLLQDIGDELGLSSADVSDLAALAQWHIRKSSSATKIRQVIKDEIGIQHPIPEALKIIARLPIRHIWTTNYDTLIERSFSELNRPHDLISAADDISLRPRAGAVRIYKMHGTVDKLNDIVISTDDYELFKKKRGAFLPLLQAHLSTLSTLFVGLSFTDPNVRHVLSLIRETFTEAPPEHFAIVRPPQRDEYRSDEEFEARNRQHELWADDLQRYGLKAIEVASHTEIPILLRRMERKLAERRVWISGSWPVGPEGAERAEFIHEVSRGIGTEIGGMGLTLVSGSGLLVGSASVSGFLSSLQQSGSWDLERRLISRAFPQPLHGQPPNLAQWNLLRAELARTSGIVIFIGGQKVAGGQVVVADGVMKEREFAKDNGSFLIPIGATGGAAKQIAEELLNSSTDSVSLAPRPSDNELKALMDEKKSASDLIALTKAIVKRVANL